MNSKMIALALLLFTANSFAAAAKTYQVTGPILEMNDTSMIVDKGGEKWEIMKDASTKVTGDLKVGAKVTVKYKMTATDVEVKADTKAAADTKKKKK